MPFGVDINKSPYGLSGGVIFSGSVSASVDGFWYYPIIASNANVVITNMVGATGSNINNITASFSAGIGVWGAINSVTQSSGIAIVYSGISAPPRY